MFHFPAFPPPPYTRSDDGGPAQPGPGSPIRTPPDQSSLANSPGHIAGRNVLHQLLVPRHPPNAPQNHTQQKHAHDHHHKTAAPRATRPPTRPTANAGQNKKGDARRQQRCSQPLYKSQTTHHNHHNPSTRPGPGGRAEPNTPPTKTGGGPPPKEGATTPPPKQEAAAPPKKRGGPRVLDVNPTARPSAHSSKAPMPNPTTRTRPTSTPPAEPTRPQAPRHHQPPPPAQSGRRGPTARRHHNRAP